MGDQHRHSHRSQLRHDPICVKVALQSVESQESEELHGFVQSICIIASRSLLSWNETLYN